MSSVATPSLPSLPEGAQFECADSRERARQWDVLLVDDFPDEEDIIKLLWCRESAQRGGGQRARAVGAGPARIHVSLRVYIRRIRSEVNLGQGCWE